MKMILDKYMQPESFVLNSDQTSQNTGGIMHSEWQLQEAKGNFSQLVKRLRVVTPSGYRTWQTHGSNSLGRRICAAHPPPG